MAQEIRQFSFTIPPGTLATAPATKDVSFPPREVATLQITVPPGPNGVVGFALQNSGVQIIPYNSDPWIITNDEKMSLDLHGYINSGSWQLTGYNTGARPHTIYVRFLLNLVTAGTAGPSPTLLAPNLLGSA